MGETENRFDGGSGASKGQTVASTKGRGDGREREGEKEKRRGIGRRKGPILSQPSDFI